MSLGMPFPSAMDGQGQNSFSSNTISTHNYPQPFNSFSAQSSTPSPRDFSPTSPSTPFPDFSSHTTPTYSSTSLAGSSLHHLYSDLGAPQPPQQQYHNQGALFLQLQDANRKLALAESRLEESRHANAQLVIEIRMSASVVHLGPPLRPSPTAIPGMRWWTKPSGEPWKKSGALAFIVTAQDKYIGAADAARIKEHAKLIFEDLLLLKLAHRRWKRVGRRGKVLFIHAMEDFCPELALCFDHWKAKALAQEVYPQWVRRGGKELLRTADGADDESEDEEDEDETVETAESKRTTSSGKRKQGSSTGEECATDGPEERPRKKQIPAAGASTSSASPSSTSSSSSSSVKPIDMSRVKATITGSNPLAAMRQKPKVPHTVRHPFVHPVQPTRTPISKPAATTGTGTTDSSRTPAPTASTAQPPPPPPAVQPPPAPPQAMQPLPAPAPQPVQSPPAEQQADAVEQSRDAEHETDHAAPSPLPAAALVLALPKPVSAVTPSATPIPILSSDPPPLEVPRSLTKTLRVLHKPEPDQAAKYALMREFLDSGHRKEDVKAFWDFVQTRAGRQRYQELYKSKLAPLPTTFATQSGVHGESSASGEPGA
ncbi:hypothetical protein EXIGLDRAFT_727067 [Exidia glandulosa HHB12029]|uniref:Uncharacterized protein n=1 Tax=Exidia glandulosa HHB12029 TaxID=1314781 RepID=A0A165M468_EXIGL|nr:hypothetical protein EXIGLDRAFT_727067 [Exidia glandulosa HHB12029]